MNRKIIIPIFLIIAAIVTIYINNEIESYNMNYYHGKDNGVFIQFESIVVLSAVFYLIMSKKNKILNAILGVLISIIICVITYITFGSGLIFPTVSLTTVIITFFIIEALRKNKINASS